MRKRQKYRSRYLPLWQARALSFWDLRVWRRVWWLASWRTPFGMLTVLSISCHAFPHRMRSLVLWVFRSWKLRILTNVRWMGICLQPMWSFSMRFGRRDRLSKIRSSPSSMKRYSAMVIGRCTFRWNSSWRQVMSCLPRARDWRHYGIDSWFASRADRSRWRRTSGRCSWKWRAV